MGIVLVFNGVDMAPKPGVFAMARCMRPALGVLLLFLCSVLTTATTLPGGRGIGNTGAYLQSTFPKHPSLVWKATLGIAGQRPSNVLFAGETAIVAFGATLYGVIGETGELRWKQEMPDVPLGDIYLLDEQIVVSTAQKGVHAYQPDTGSQLWKSDLFSSISNGPFITDDALLYATRANTIEIIGRKNGKKMASANIARPIAISPIRHGQSLLFFFVDGNMTRVEGGITRWSARIPDIPLTMNPMTDGRLTLLHAANGVIYSLNTSSNTAAVRWKYQNKNMLPEPSVFDGNTLYLATRDGRLQAVDATSGKAKWGEEGVLLPAPAVGGPLLIGDQLFLRLQHGMIALCDIEKGQVSWQYRLGSGAPLDTHIGLPMVVGQHVLVAAADGVLYHLSTVIPDVDPPSFREVLPTRAGSDFSSPPVLHHVGAIIEDEGSGLLPGSVTITLNGVDLTPRVQYLAGSGYYLAELPAQMKLAPGMHRLEMNARDYAGNSGRHESTFFIGATPNSERIPILINARYLPTTLTVRPGAMIQWVNASGGYRTVIADDGTFNSDEPFPRGIADGESFLWIVPLNAKPGTRIPYHCRLNGAAGDGKEPGSGLAGLIEVVDPQRSYPGIPDAGDVLLTPFPLPPVE